MTLAKLPAGCSDHVETADVTAREYAAGDIGCRKVDATAAAVRHLDPDIRVETISDLFRPRYRTGEAVFCCVDSITARQAIWRSVGDRCAFRTDGRCS